MNNSITQHRTHPKDAVLYILIYASAAFAVLLLAGMILYIAAKGIKTVNFSFLTSVTSVLHGTVGIAGNIVNTLYIIFMTMIIATPIGIGAAVYLNEYAAPGGFVTAVEFALETLSGIPSIIFGLFGMVFFGTTMGLGYSLWTGALTLSLMVLPLITRNTQEALKTVPESYREGAIGLGTGKWYMIRTILIPSAMPGILTGVILAIGRIVGESAALLFTAGSAKLLPTSISNLLSKTFESGGTLTIQLYLSMQKGEYDVAFGIAVVLLIIVLGINMLARFLTKKYDLTQMD
jgi:phosphate transport system permease protein